MNKKLLVTLAVSVMLLSGCGAKKDVGVINVNGIAITKEKYEQVFTAQSKNGILAQLGYEIKGDDDTSPISIMVRQRVVEELIVKALLEEEIAKRKIEVTDEEINTKIEEVIEKLGSKEQLDKVMKSNGLSPDGLKKSVTLELQVQKLISQLGEVQISDEDAKKYYDENIAKFTHPESVRASHILIASNPMEIEEIIKSEPENAELTAEEIKTKVDAQIKEKEQKAKELLAEVKKNPASFGKFAKENSDDTNSAVKGGDLGFFGAQEMVPEFSEAAFALKPNTISETVIQTPYGYHIIMVIDRKEASVDTFEEAKTDIVEFLTKKEEVQKMNDLVESLKKTAKIDYVNPKYDPDQMGEDLKKLMQADRKKRKEAEKERKAKVKAAKEAREAEQEAEQKADEAVTMPETAETTPVAEPVEVAPAPAEETKAE